MTHFCLDHTLVNLIPKPHYNLSSGTIESISANQGRQKPGQRSLHFTNEAAAKTCHKPAKGPSSVSGTQREGPLGAGPNTSQVFPCLAQREPGPRPGISPFEQTCPPFLPSGRPRTRQAHKSVEVMEEGSQIGLVVFADKRRKFHLLPVPRRTPSVPCVREPKNPLKVCCSTGKQSRVSQVINSRSDEGEDPEFSRHYFPATFLSPGPRRGRGLI